jgi:PAS domain-containing protein
MTLFSQIPPQTFLPAEADLTPPVGDLIDLIDLRGVLLWANGAQLAALGYADDALSGGPVEQIYRPDSAAWVRAQLQRPVAIAPSPAVELCLRGRHGRELRVLACALPRREADAGLTLSKRPLGELAERLARLEADNRLLKRIADAGNEAHWCIEFASPIDLNLKADEIVFRVFSYPSYWRLCNQAMSRLYGLPRHLDWSAQSVRTYWPRSPENEAFVRQIIAAGYSIDGALSVDTRHDGQRIRVENDVRADVEDGYLVRLWGNCRLLDEVSGLPR